MWDKNFITIILVVVFGFTCLIGIFYKMNKGFGPFNLKVYGLTIVIIFISILGLSSVSSDKLTPCFSILGAIAGYLFGLKKE